MPRDGTQTRERILDGAEQLILDQGFAATSVDAVLAESGASKGAFFHHFPSKNHLARALVARYATDDVAHLEDLMAKAEAESDDPGEQVVAFIRAFELSAGELVAVQPSCLYVSFIYEKQLFDDGTNDLIVEALIAWRKRLLEKLEAAAELHPPALEVDLPSLADQVTATFEGAYVLVRAMGDPTLMQKQLAHVRNYVTLLFGLPPG
jgi:TetR/AcrR family transcriptional regulator, transcriptional repressor for nem operon